MASGVFYKFYKGMISAGDKFKDFVMFPKRVLGISKIIKKPTYYPELKRKSKGKMWRENFKWLCKNKELNKFYTSYGLDIKDLHDINSFIPHREFCVIRNEGNQALKKALTGEYNYIVLLRDKYAFSAYLESTIGKDKVVSNVALISKGQVFKNLEKEWISLEEFLEADGELVYKVIDGECADGVMLVNTEGESVRVDDKVYTKQEFIESIKDQKIIVQNVVKQHSALQAFGTRSVNTIRVVTIQGKSGAVGVFAAFLRLSASADSFVDNRAKGGLGIGVDLQTGKLMKYGLPHDSFGVKLEEHPLSGIHFEGYQLPYWEETVELVKNAHKQFYEIQSIGWDVILTENGPVLLEGNDDWEIGGPQDTYGGLKQRWSELTNG